MNVLQRNDRWFSLTTHHLGISEQILRAYLDHGDSVLIANLIHFTRNFLKVNWEKFPLSTVLLGLKSNFNIQDTLPSLQHDFCSLWNEIFIQTRDVNHRLPNILWEIQPIYVALHQGSTPPDEFQLCSIPTHSPSTAHTPITTSTHHHHDPVPSATPPATEHCPSFIYVKSGSRGPTPG